MGLYDIEEYDHIYVTVRRDKLDELKYCYEQFGWEEVERQEHKVYENLLDMTFRRPHKIADKDELLLLQVHLEESLNTVGKYERAPKVRTKLFATCLGLFAFALIACGLPLGIVAPSLVAEVFGYMMAGIGIVITPLICIFGVKLWHHENEVEARRLKIARELCMGICYSANQIRERGNGALEQTVKPAKEIVEKIAKKTDDEETAEKLLAKVLDVTIKTAIMAEGIAQEEGEGAEAEDAETVAKEAEAAGDEVIFAGDAVIVVEPDSDSGAQDAAGMAPGTVPGNAQETAGAEPETAPGNVRETAGEALKTAPEAVPANAVVIPAKAPDGAEPESVVVPDMAQDAAPDGAEEGEPSAAKQPAPAKPASNRFAAQRPAKEA